MLEGGRLSPRARSYLGRLSSSGTSLTVRDKLGRKIGTITYKSSWYSKTSGKGRSLTLVEPQGKPGAWSKQEAWRASRRDLGSPGREAAEITPAHLPLLL